MYPYMYPADTGTLHLLAGTFRKTDDICQFTKCIYQRYIERWLKGQISKIDLQFGAVSAVGVVMDNFFNFD